ncbi:phage repressor protein C with HTH and peptisase S24 domain [Bradyrhizobium elkanii USDA 61]|uniref:XRE family transcriptional regulator n=2 Tax=Bradyrhizobium elkanii TaxID=29448 RepID=UPI001448F554|nr:helix-turn-helix domain-containing protein [Bradyrhizobium elkanii]MCS4004213.1 phage repressor protein C with HTH and peptisase S24 domain [Bradyrhizobium elkanii USDA 61]MCP1932539.1 phage repressor protein C with HTH and peptisase S24 domain [Bradyrhizobium elkanii]MCS3479534.1 phage repressor protein C with HTH and peptisase S24 domain [Bradyrhizobium elkanii]MCS3576919.1 phage repressor protein C with HTH and peptisase S24 domain [Bradyrhizobium elkanii]MCS3719796.1 phage repressor pro
MKDAESPAMFFPMGKLANRIKFVRKRAKLSQEKFAEALGTVEDVKVTRGAVGNWELGGGISRGNLAAIAEKFGVSLDWLESGRGELPQTVNAPSDAQPLTSNQKPHTLTDQIKQNARIGEGVGAFTRIPIRGKGMGGKEGYLILADQYLGDVLAPPALVDVPDAYAVYVIGDSMLERYQHGEIVYVHPYAPVRKDDDCVIQISMGDGEPPHGFVKRFVSMDDAQLKVRQLNPKKVITFPRNKVLAVHRIIMGGPA